MGVGIGMGKGVEVGVGLEVGVLGMEVRMTEKMEVRMEER